MLKEMAHSCLPYGITTVSILTVYQSHHQKPCPGRSWIRGSLGLGEQWLIRCPAVKADTQEAESADAKPPEVQWEVIGGENPLEVIGHGRNPLEAIGKG